MSKILITPRSLTRESHPALGMLTQAGYELVLGPPGRQPSEEELFDLLPGCVGYLAGVEHISAEVLEAAIGLKVISRNGTGIDNIDLEAAQRTGVRICRAEGANAQGVAELTIGLLLALVRSIPYCDRRMKDGDWERVKGSEITGRALGIVGCGRIGQRVALLALALGMKVIAHDVYRPDFVPSGEFRWGESLESVLSQADVVSLHCPGPGDDKPLIGRAAFSWMKQGSYLINTARAELVDDQAALEALESGRLAGLATDVYRQEPPSERGLLSHERVIATPHLGAFTAESISRATTEAVKNLLHCLAG